MVGFRAASEMVKTCTIRTFGMCPCVSATTTVWWDLGHWREVYNSVIQQAELCQKNLHIQYASPETDLPTEGGPHAPRSWGTQELFA